jgi:hypothetical protein
VAGRRVSQTKSGSRSLGRSAEGCSPRLCAPSTGTSTPSSFECTPLERGSFAPVGSEKAPGYFSDLGTTPLLMLPDRPWSSVSISRYGQEPTLSSSPPPAPSVTYTPSFERAASGALYPPRSSLTLFALQHHFLASLPKSRAACTPHRTALIPKSALSSLYCSNPSSTAAGSLIRKKRISPFSRVSYPGLSRAIARRPLLNPNRTPDRAQIRVSLLQHLQHCCLPHLRLAFSSSLCQRRDIRRR